MYPRGALFPPPCARGEANGTQWVLMGAIARPAAFVARRQRRREEGQTVNSTLVISRGVRCQSCLEIPSWPLLAHLARAAEIAEEFGSQRSRSSDRRRPRGIACTKGFGHLHKTAHEVAVVATLEKLLGRSVGQLPCSESQRGDLRPQESTDSEELSFLGAYCLSGFRCERKMLRGMMRGPQSKSIF